MQRLLASKKTVGRLVVGKPPKLKVTSGVKGIRPKYPELTDKTMPIFLVFV